MCVSEMSYSLQVRRGGGGGGGGSRLLNHRIILSRTIQMKIFFHFVRLSEMSFTLLVRLDKDLDLCGAIS